MRVDAVILARGGSKGVPGKNIIDFCGKPLLAWTIEQCLQADSVDAVWISSDDDNILSVASGYDVNLIKRPREISGDHATSESGWMHAVEYLEKKDVFSDAILAPQVTSPLRCQGDFDRALNVFFSQGFDSLFSASLAEDLFFWEVCGNGRVKSVNYDFEDRKRRQDINQQIIENGSFYIFSPDSLRKERNRFGGKIGYSKMKFWQMFEIDNMEDFRMCSALMKEFLVGN